MDILNFISWIRARRVVKSVPDDSLVPVGVRDPRRDDRYLTVAIKKSDLISGSGSGSGVSEYKQALLPSPSYTSQTTPHPEYAGEVIDIAYPVVGYPFIRLQNGNLASVQYCQSRLKNGIFIYEAYELDPIAPLVNSGWWIAFEQDANDPTLLNKVAELKMTDQFWDYWYDWTVKDGADNKVKLVICNYPSDDGTTIESWFTELTYSNGTLTATDTHLTFGSNTVLSLYNSYQSFPIVGGTWEYKRPEYILDDDYYGMAVGTQVGWFYYRMNHFGDRRDWNTVGFNIITGETRYIEPADTIFSTVTNFNFDFILEDRLIQDWVNHPHGISYSFCNAFLPDNGNNVNGVTCLWSPYFQNPNEVLYLTARDSDSGAYLATGGTTIFLNYYYWDNYNFYISQSNDAYQAYSFQVQQFNVNTKEVKTYNIPRFDNSNDYGLIASWANNDGLMLNYNTIDGVFGMFRYNYMHKEGGYTIVQSNNYYPTNMIGNQTFSCNSQLLRNCFNLGVEIDEYKDVQF